MTTLTAMKKDELLEYVLEVHETDLSESGMTRDQILSEAMKLDARAEVAAENAAAAPAESDAINGDDDFDDTPAPTQAEKEAMAETQPEGMSLVKELKAQSQFKLRIFASEGEEGSHPVKLSINGYAYLIPRDKECTVPKAVLDVLENSVVTQFYYDNENNIRSRDVRRFNFTATPAD
jgi:hypothetical protein